MSMKTFINCKFITKYSIIERQKLITVKVSVFVKIYQFGIQ